MNLTDNFIVSSSLEQNVQGLAHSLELRTVHSCDFGVGTQLYITVGKNVAADRPYAGGAKLAVRNVSLNGSTLFDNNSDVVVQSDDISDVELVLRYRTVGDSLLLRDLLCLSLDITGKELVQAILLGKGALKSKVSKLKKQVLFKNVTAGVCTHKDTKGEVCLTRVEPPIGKNFLVGEVSSNLISPEGIAKSVSFEKLYKLYCCHLYSTKFVFAELPRMTGGDIIMYKSACRAWMGIEFQDYVSRYMERVNALLDIPSIVETRIKVLKEQDKYSGVSYELGTVLVKMLKNVVCEPIGMTTSIHALTGDQTSLTISGIKRIDRCPEPLLLLEDDKVFKTRLQEKERVEQSKDPRDVMKAMLEKANAVYRRYPGEADYVEPDSEGESDGSGGFGLEY